MKTALLLPTSKPILITEKRINNFISTLQNLFDSPKDFILEINNSINELKVDEINNRKEILFYERTIERILDNNKKVLHN